MFFIDDIFILSRTEEEHLSHLEPRGGRAGGRGGTQEWLRTLQQHQLYVKLSKCKFGLPEVDFLGHIVSAEGVKVDPSKTAAIQQ